MKKLVTVNPRKKIKEMRMRFFDRELDFRVRLFNVLAIAGTAISLAATVVNLITSMWVSAAVSGLLAVLSFALTYFTYKTGKYQTGYIITIIAIFMVFFPMLFFTSGGYKGGTPALFIFAVLFTTLMLEGKWAILVSFAEIAEYVIIAVIAYKILHLLHGLPLSGKCLRTLFLLLLRYVLPAELLYSFIFENTKRKELSFRNRTSS